MVRSDSTRRDLLKKSATAIGGLSLTAGFSSASSNNRYISLKQLGSDAGTYESDYEIWFTTTDIEIEHTEGEEEQWTETKYNKTYGVVSGTAKPESLDPFDYSGDRIKIPRDEFIYKVKNKTPGSGAADLRISDERHNGTRGDADGTFEIEGEFGKYNVNASNGVSKSSIENLEGEDGNDGDGQGYVDDQGGIDTYDIQGQVTYMRLPKQSTYKRVNIE